MKNKPLSQKNRFNVTIKHYQARSQKYATRVAGLRLKCIRRGDSLL